MTAKAELLTQSPDGRRGAERRLQGDVSAACNSIVLPTALQTIRRTMSLCEANRLAEQPKMWRDHAEIRITIFQNQLLKNAKFTHDLLLKIELLSVPLQAI